MHGRDTHLMPQWLSRVQRTSCRNLFSSLFFESWNLTQIVKHIRKHTYLWSHFASSQQLHFCVIVIKLTPCNSEGTMYMSIAYSTQAMWNSKCAKNFKSRSMNEDPIWLSRKTVQYAIFWNELVTMYCFRQLVKVDASVSYTLNPHIRYCHWAIWEILTSRRLS